MISQGVKVPTFRKRRAESSWLTKGPVHSLKEQLLHSCFRRFLTEQHLSRLIWERKILLREFQRASSYATRKDVDHHQNWFVGLCSAMDCSPRPPSAMKKNATDLVSVIGQFANELDVLVRRQAMEVHGLKGTAQILGSSPPHQVMIQ
mmetsp:Transcript_25705/g.101377  ORF Transcript_25705/g.101377 Transcript_25705/m.101377 type:complete len:148 (+) Transcript_25705:1975-2418(+)